VPNLLYCRCITVSRSGIVFIYLDINLEIFFLISGTNLFDGNTGTKKFLQNGLTKRKFTSFVVNQKYHTSETGPIYCS